jgi:transcriptional regulator with XRE-family HTH domain
MLRERMQAMSKSVDDVIEWVRLMMAENRVTQENLGEILGLSQPAIWNRLSGLPGKTNFKLHEIAKLEAHFGQPSPLRDQPSGATSSIEPEVLRAVIKHLAREYPKVLRADPEEMSEAILAMCEFVQSNDHRPITRAESKLALRSLVGTND